MKLASLDKTLEKLQPPSHFTVCTYLLGNWWKAGSLWEPTPLVTRIASPTSDKAEKTTNTARLKVSRLRQTRISLSLTASALSPIMSDALGTAEDAVEAHTGALKELTKNKNTIFDSSKTMFFKLT